MEEGAVMLEVPLDDPLGACAVDGCGCPATQAVEPDMVTECHIVVLDRFALCALHGFEHLAAINLSALR